MLNFGTSKPRVKGGIRALGSPGSHLNAHTHTHYLSEHVDGNKVYNVINCFGECEHFTGLIKTMPDIWKLIIKFDKQIISRLHLNIRIIHLSPLRATYCDQNHFKFGCGFLLANYRN